MNNLTVNQKVTVSNPDSSWLGCVWWPKGTVTGTVQKIFKNGRVAVAVDQLYVAGGDNKRTLHFKSSELS